MSTHVVPIDGFTPIPNRTTTPYTRSVEECMNFGKFFKVLKSMWERAHPDILIYHAGHEYFAPSFPCITISVFSEVPEKGWGKPRPVEVIPGTTGATGSAKDLIQLAQFFELIIRADVYSTQDSGGAETAEEIVEAFKSFMQEFTYVFLMKGHGDIRYTKRFVDENVVRLGDLYAVKRSLAYTSRAQTITYVLMDHLESVATEVMVSWDSDEIIDGPIVDSAS
jgi:hypothetical protein